MDRRDTQLLTISVTTRTVTMPVTTTRGATLSLAEEELNSQEKNTQGPQFPRFQRGTFLHAAMDPLRKQFGPVDSSLSQHGAHVSLTNTL